MSTLKVVAWNVRGLDMKQLELEWELNNKSINLAVISETKKKLKGTKMWNE